MAAPGPGTRGSRSQPRRRGLTPVARYQVSHEQAEGFGEQSAATGSEAVTLARAWEAQGRPGVSIEDRETGEIWSPEAFLAWRDERCDAPGAADPFTG